MSGSKESITHFIVQRVTEETCGNQASENPTVLSCGGMYLPRPKLNPQDSRVIYHILSLANQNEPTKIFTGRRPINALFQILSKENMN